MRKIVVVDGGASCCRLAAFSESGDELARVSLDKHASLSMGVLSAWQHIAQGLDLLGQRVSRHDCSQPIRLVMGLAGSLQQQRRKEFLAHVSPEYQVTLVTDGYAQLMGATKGKPGICISIGTGSVLHWLDEQGQSGMAGGWGFPVGDYGSGAWLGMRAVQCYIESRDAHDFTSSLIMALQHTLGTEVSQVQTWTTQTRATVFARLAPVVFEHALMGDTLARSLINEAVTHCLQLISKAPPALPVHVVGGIGDQLREQLANALPGRVRCADQDALHGLWLISRNTP